MVTFFNLGCFLKVWCNRSSNSRSFYIKSLWSYHHEAMTSCSRLELFTFDYTDTCEEIQSLITQQNINHFSISMFKYKKFIFFCQWLSLFSGNISYNPSPFHQDMHCLNKWNVFKNRDYISFTWVLTVFY